MKLIHSCGVIPVIRDHGKLRYLLVQHKSGHWGFPKGHMEKGETPMETALRELEEEVGIKHVEIVPNAKFTDHYSIRTSHGMAKKTVTLFLGKLKSPNIHLKRDELLDVHWFDYHTANLILGKLSTGQSLRGANTYLRQHTWT